MKKRLTNQAFSAIDPKPAIDCVNNPVLYFSQFHATKRKLLNSLLSLRNKYNYLCPTIDTLAHSIDKTPITVHRLINELIEDGLIAKNYRHMTSNEYKVSSWFLHQNNRYIVAPLLKACRVLLFTSALLLSQIAASAIKSTNVIQAKANNIYIKSLFRNERVNNARVTLNTAKSFATILEEISIVPKKGSVMKYEQADKPDYVNNYSQRDKEPEQIDRRKLFPVYEPPVLSKRDYKADTLRVTKWLQSTDEKAMLGKEFLATLPEDVVVNLVRNHFAPSEREDEE